MSGASLAMPGGIQAVGAAIVISLTIGFYSGWRVKAAFVDAGRTASLEAAVAKIKTQRDQKIASAKEDQKHAEQSQKKIDFIKAQIARHNPRGNERLPDELVRLFNNALDDPL